MLVDMSEGISVDEFAEFEVRADETLADDGQSPELDGQSPEIATGAADKSPELSSPEPSAEDMAERLWWDKVEVMSKIKDCARMIQEVESEVDGYQDQIKEAKEVLKGQQALLSRYSSQLADIMDGHPLPKNPNAPAKDAVSEDGVSQEDEAAPSDGDWRSTPTEILLKDLPGLGKRKIELLIEVAPTAGHLETLRGQASMAHKRFKEVLPNGFGETLTDLMEDRLVEHVAKYSKNAAEEYEDVSDDDSQSETKESLQLA